ncbi:hypothetical protein C8Q76DRAFT_694120 [Earliella scabrosa]|nr:hypothetical protein C8Q76DRAFT_694120 [Earliella scabrosa]
MPASARQLPLDDSMPWFLCALPRPLLLILPAGNAQHDGTPHTAAFRTLLLQVQPLSSRARHVFVSRDEYRACVRADYNPLGRHSPSAIAQRDAERRALAASEVVEEGFDKARKRAWGDGDRFNVSAAYANSIDIDCEPHKRRNAFEGSDRFVRRCIRTSEESIELLKAIDRIVELIPTPSPSTEFIGAHAQGEQVEGAYNAPQEVMDHAEMEQDVQVPDEPKLWIGVKEEEEEQLVLNWYPCVSTDCLISVKVEVEEGSIVPTSLHQQPSASGSCNSQDPSALSTSAVVDNTPMIRMESSSADDLASLRALEYPSSTTTPAQEPSTPVVRIESSSTQDLAQLLSLDSAAHNSAPAQHLHLASEDAAMDTGYDQETVVVQPKPEPLEDVMPTAAVVPAQEVPSFSTTPPSATIPGTNVDEPRIRIESCSAEDLALLHGLSTRIQAQAPSSSQVRIESSSTEDILWILDAADTPALPTQQPPAEEDAIMDISEPETTNDKSEQRPLNSTRAPCPEVEDDDEPIIVSWKQPSRRSKKIGVQLLKLEPLDEVLPPAIVASSQEGPSSTTCAPPPTLTWSTEPRASLSTPVVPFWATLSSPSGQFLPERGPYDDVDMSESTSARSVADSMDVSFTGPSPQQSEAREIDMGEESGMRPVPSQSDVDMDANEEIPALLVTDVKATAPVRSDEPTALPSALVKPEPVEAEVIPDLPASVPVEASQSESEQHKWVFTPSSSVNLADLVEAPIEGLQSNEDVYAESQSELRLSHLELRIAHAEAAAEPERHLQSYEDFGEYSVDEWWSYREPAPSIHGEEDPHDVLSASSSCASSIHQDSKLSPTLTWLVRQWNLREHSFNSYREPTAVIDVDEEEQDNGTLSASSSSTFIRACEPSPTVMQLVSQLTLEEPSGLPSMDSTDSIDTFYSMATSDSCDTFASFACLDSSDSFASLASVDSFCTAVDWETESEGTTLCDLSTTTDDFSKDGDDSTLTFSLDASESVSSDSEWDDCTGQYLAQFLKGDMARKISAPSSVSFQQESVVLSPVLVNEPIAVPPLVDDVELDHEDLDQLPKTSYNWCRRFLQTFVVVLVVGLVQPALTCA